MMMPIPSPNTALNIIAVSTLVTFAPMIKAMAKSTKVILTRFSSPSFLIRGSTITDGMQLKTDITAKMTPIQDGSSRIKAAYTRKQPANRVYTAKDTDEIAITLPFL